MASNVVMPLRRARTSNRLWRVFANHLATVAAVGATVLVMAPLIAIFFYLIYKGASSLNLAFFTQIPKPVGEVGGGMANAIVGSGVLLAIASLMGVPIGIAGGIYIAEFGRNKRLANMVRFTADVLNGVPSIVMGIAVFTLIRPFRRGGVGYHDDPDHYPHHRRDAADGAPQCARGRSRARRPQLAFGSFHHIADCISRCHYRLHAGLCPGCGGDSAAAVYRVRESVLEREPESTDRGASVADFRLCNLPLRRMASSCLGRRVGVDCADRPLRRTSSLCSEPRSSEGGKLVGVEIEVSDLNAWYGTNHTLQNISLRIPANHATALIGPSGCGKSTFVRCLNRMHETNPIGRVTGTVRVGPVDIYAQASPVEIRRRIGMVFQRPNPFPTMSIYDNVASGLRLNGFRNRKILDEVVERSLQQAALWDEVKNDLKKKSGASLSGGQQQRLCIARALAVDPEVMLMDEPASALDPVSTAKIEDLIFQLKSQYTIVIVTHNMQQAARVAENTGFFLNGKLVEFDATHKIFTNPTDKRTEDYITGRFG